MPKMPRKVLGNVNIISLQGNKDENATENLKTNANRNGIKRNGDNLNGDNNVKKGRSTLSNVTNNHNDLKKSHTNQKECESIKNKPKITADVTKSIERKVKNISISSTNTSDEAASDKLEAAVSDAAEVNRVEYDFENPLTYYRNSDSLPTHIEDFDKTQIYDCSSEPQYAADIFNYYKNKELTCMTKKYMSIQYDLSKGMRAVLVDWMVEVQESFELNHETLYLAVKIVDHYLVKEVIKKAQFQLIGATALLIAAKFDERIPPAIEDFLYICDDAYTRRELILMEMDMFQKLGFYIGFPISYRFLRRYARTAKTSMETLTLARYVLEMALMEYDLIDERDSQLAASALLLALKMKNLGGWTTTLEHYSGYEEEELLPLLKKLNSIISAPPKSNLKTIRTKYSHKIFFEVAKISPLPQAV